LGPVTWKLGAFANDMVVGLGEEGDVTIIQEGIQKYERVAGAKLNWDKCETMDIGTGLGEDGRFGKTVVKGAAVRYLGIWFSVYGTVLPEEWWRNMVQKWEEILTKWAG